MDTATLKTPADILKAALVKEQQAHDFYEHMGLTCKVEMVVELLDLLKNEESRHLRLIQAMLAKLEID